MSRFVFGYRVNALLASELRSELFMFFAFYSGCLCSRVSKWLDDTIDKM
jgi:hypothetical protein